MESKLEDRPIITINGRSPTPGVDPEIWSRYQRWHGEVYSPMYFTMPGRNGVDNYAIVKERAEYPSFITLIHTESIKFIQESLKHPARTALIGEAATWVKRHVSMFIWSTRYALIKSFRSEPLGTPAKEDTKIENAPILHIEGYRVWKEDQDKYLSWLNDYGFGSFIPLLMRLSGIKGYDCYKNIGSTNFREVETRELEYPDFLSILYFEDEAAFENYTKSPELLAFQKAISNVFLNGLTLRWYVQYQLIKSFRK